MHYAYPNFTPLFFALLAAISFYIWSMKRRRALLERFAERGLIAALAPTASRRRKIFKASLQAFSLALILLAFARPQRGFEWEEVKRSGLDILIAMDVSRSMLAKDMKPNRLERSKYAVKDLVKRLSGDRIGLIAFAGTSFLQCPLTIDYNGFLLALDDLNVGTIPRGGSSLSSAMEEALKAFRGPEKKYKVLILISDGEELEGDAIARVAEAEKTGVKIYAVGVGTKEGDLIPIIGETGQRAYAADRRGNTVKTALNEELLKRIAISTGGSYVRATQADFGLTLLYDKSISKLEKREIESKMKKRYRERFQLPLAIAIAILFIEPLISDRKMVSA